MPRYYVGFSTFDEVSEVSIPFYRCVCEATSERAAEEWAEQRVDRALARSSDPCASELSPEIWVQPLGQYVDWLESQARALEEPLEDEEALV
jgi:hypothetical protein